MNRIKNSICIIITTIVMFFSFSLVPSTVTYAKTTSICNQDSVPDEVKAANGCDVSAKKKSKELREVIIGIINGVIAVLGVVAVIFVIVGGINYMTSQGDPGKVKKAKDTVLYALIGLIICALAFAIVNFVIKGILPE